MLLVIWEAPQFLECLGFPYFLMRLLLLFYFFHGLPVSNIFESIKVWQKSFVKDMAMILMGNDTVDYEFSHMK